MKKTKWISSRIALTEEDIWNLLPHKRNEKFGGVLYFPQIQMYYITTMKKQYRRRKK